MEADDEPASHSSSPPHHPPPPPSLSLGSPLDVQLQPSDDDDRDQDPAASAIVVSTDDLKLKIIKQVEYYFSDENLPTDKYLMSVVKKNKEGFENSKHSHGFKILVYLDLKKSKKTTLCVLGCATNLAREMKMKKLTQDYSLTVAALRESSQLVVSSDGKKVKRLHPLPLTEAKDPKLCTVLVENLPEDHSMENIRRTFGEAGNIKNISIRYPHTLEESTKVRKAEMLMSSKLHALVEYYTVEAAEKAAATLNNEQDWRNGMRVKLLKRMDKYGQKNSWRGHDSEKNIVGPLSDKAADNEDHNSSEHRSDTADEENGEHLSKEKDAQRGRNRGKARRHKYHGTNGQGHGTTHSSHGIEPSKPPPGPRMPDGTRGFTMGRGRPPISN